MKRELIVGVMGGGAAAPRDIEDAYRLGSLIAREGWILLNGGRNAGIMDASARGAHDHGGLTVGVLPDDDDRQASPYIRIPIRTGMGGARNLINVLSSDVVAACPGGAGTISEIALALKYGKTVILLNFDAGRLFDAYKATGRLRAAAAPEEVIKQVKEAAGL